MDEILSRDQNHVTVLAAITNDVNQIIKMLRVDPATGRLLVSAVVAGTNNGQLKVSAADTTYGYLATKLVAGTNVTLTIVNPGANETLRIDVGGTGYDTVQEDGVSVTQRNILNFEHGFDVNDNVGNLSTDVNIDESELDLGLMGGLLDLSTQVTGLLDAINIDQSSLDISLMGGLLDWTQIDQSSVLVDLSTQVTGTLSSTNIDITQLEGDLDLSNIAGVLDLSTQVTGILDVSHLDQSTFDLSMMGGQINLASQVSGTLPLLNGGTGNSLTDPTYNSILGWDDTDNSVSFWHLGSGLSYDHATHTLSSVAGQGLGGTQFLAIAKDFDDSGGNGAGFQFNTIRKGRQVLHDEVNKRIYVAIGSEQGASTPDSRATYMRIFKNDFGNYFQESEIRVDYNDIPGAISTAVIAVCWALSATNLYAVINYLDGGDPSGVAVVQFDLDGTNRSSATIYSIPNLSNALEQFAWDSNPSGGGGTEATACTIVGDSLFMNYKSRPNTGADYSNEFREYDISAFPTITLVNTYTVSTIDVGAQDQGHQFAYDADEGCFLMLGLDDNALDPQITRYEISGSTFVSIAVQKYNEISYGNNAQGGTGDVASGYVLAYLVPTSTYWTIYDVQRIVNFDFGGSSNDVTNSWWLETRNYPKF